VIALVTALALLAPGPRLVSKPPALVVGEVWRAAIVAPARPRVRASAPGRVLAFAVTRARPRRYEVALRFPAAGTWLLIAVVHGRATRLARIHVTPSYALELPAGILARDDGSLLVVERGRNRILEVGPDGRFDVFARGIPAAWGLEADGTSALVSGGDGIYRVAAKNERAARIATVRASPIVRAPTGDIYYANESEVGRIAAGSGEPRPFNVEVAAPHGLALETDALYVSDTGNGRILRIDLASGVVTLHASGFHNLLGIEPEPDGSLLGTEHDTGRVLRIPRSGPAEIVATGLHKPYALDRAADGTLWVVESGEVGRPSGRIARIDARGAVSRLTLLPR
jgi:streptogramin lyase